MSKQFPEVSGSNLLRESVAFPQDFKAEYNLVLIAFYQPQQYDINTWLSFAAKLESEQPGFTYYELPVIRSMNPLSRWFINEGMRAGIGDPDALARTVTLYLDKREFRRRLGIESENAIQVLLVDRSGKILWRTSGRFNEHKAAALFEQMKDRQSLEGR